MAAPPDASMPTTGYVPASAEDSGITSLERNPRSVFRLLPSFSIFLKRRGARTRRRDGARPRGREGAGARACGRRGGRERRWGRGTFTKGIARLFLIPFLDI